MGKLRNPPIYEILATVLMGKHVGWKFRKKPPKNQMAKHLSTYLIEKSSTQWKNTKGVQVIHIALKTAIKEAKKEQ